MLLAAYLLAVSSLYLLVWRVDNLLAEALVVPFVIALLLPVVVAEARRLLHHRHDVHHRGVKR